jgi:hypothetical protein
MKDTVKKEKRNESIASIESLRRGRRKIPHTPRLPPLWPPMGTRVLCSDVQGHRTGFFFFFSKGSIYIENLRGE